MRGRWMILLHPSPVNISVYVSLISIGGYRRTQLYHQSVCFTRIGKVSAENTKYAEHYTSYGNSFRIYGDFEEILKKYGGCLRIN